MIPSVLRPPRPGSPKVTAVSAAPDTSTTAVDDLLWVNDPDDKLIFANRRWEEAFGTVADVGPANRVRRAVT